MSGPVHFPGVRRVPLLIAASAVLLAMPGLAQHQGHGGRDGWWWVAGPSWYYYPVPAGP